MAEVLCISIPLAVSISMTNQQIAVTLTAEQIRNAYQALSNVPTECRRDMLAIFDEHHAEWKYQLPGNAYHQFQQLEDRETWAIETMGILAAHAGILGVPVTV